MYKYTNTIVNNTKIHIRMKEKKKKKKRRKKKVY